MILFDVCLEASPGQETALGELMRRTGDSCTTEPGCLTYRFTRDLDDSRRFHLLELWADEMALQAHATGAPFRIFLSAHKAHGRIVSSIARRGDLEPYSFGRPNAEREVG